MTFDSVGRPIETTSAAGKQTKFRFDSLSRLTKVTYQDGKVDLEYDRNNNLVSMHDKTGTTTFTYDPRNRLIEKSSPLEFDSKYSTCVY
jgi:YD repeat-containing protein